MKIRRVATLSLAALAALAAILPACDDSGPRATVSGRRAPGVPIVDREDPPGPNTAGPGNAAGGSAAASASETPAVTDADYILLLRSRHLWHDAALSPQTRIKLSWADDATGLPPGEAVDTPSVEIAGRRLKGLGPAIKSVLRSEEDARFRELFDRSGLRHVVIRESGIAASVDVPQYVSPEWDDLKQKAQDAKARESWEDTRDVPGTAVPGLLEIGSLDAALGVLNGGEDPHGTFTAAAWLLRTKLDPDRRSDVMKAVARFFSPFRDVQANTWSRRPKPGEAHAALVSVALRWGNWMDAEMMAKALGEVLFRDDSVGSDSFARCRESLGVWLAKVAAKQLETVIRANIDSDKKTLSDLLLSLRDHADANVAAVGARLYREWEIAYLRRQAAKTGKEYETDDERAMTPVNIVKWLNSGKPEKINRALLALDTVTIPDDPKDLREATRLGLMNVINVTNEEFTRESACRHLGRYGRPEDAGLLLRYMDAFDTPGKAGTAGAAMTAALRLDGRAARKEIESRAGNPKVIEALTALAAAGPEVAEPAGVALLESGLAALRQKGRDILKARGTDNVTAALRTAARNEKDKAEKATLELLARKVALRRPGSTALGTLLPGGGRKPVALPVPDAPRDKEQALEWIDTGSATNRLAAITFFKLTPVTGAELALVKKNMQYFMDDGEGEIRFEAIRALMLHGNPEDGKRLMTLVKGNDIDYAVVAAAIALKLNAAEMVPLLPKMRPEALDKIFSEITAAGSVAESAAFAALSSVEPDLRGRGADVLATIGSNRYVTSLNGLLGREKDPVVRGKIQNALDRIAERARAGG